jgi:hypothetical protein
MDEDISRERPGCSARNSDRRPFFLLVAFTSLDCTKAEIISGDTMRPDLETAIQIFFMMPPAIIVVGIIGAKLVWVIAGKGSTENP